MLSVNQNRHQDESRAWFVRMRQRRYVRTLVTINLMLASNKHILVSSNSVVRLSDFLQGGCLTLAVKTAVVV